MESDDLKSKMDSGFGVGSDSDHPVAQPAGPDAARTEEFVGLWATNQQSVFLYLRSLLGNRREVDDLFQETSLVCWREFDRFTPGTNFGAWASTVAFNRVRAWRKKSSRDRLIFSEEFLVAVSDELMKQEPETQDRVEALRRCVAQLSTHHRELIRQRYSGERSIESLAEQLDRSCDAIYRMLSRIRHALHKCVTQNVSSGDKQ